MSDQTDKPTADSKACEHPDNATTEAGLCLFCGAPRGPQKVAVVDRDTKPDNLVALPSAGVETRPIIESVNDRFDLARVPAAEITRFADKHCRYCAGRGYVMLTVQSPVVGGDRNQWLGCQCALSAYECHFQDRIAEALKKQGKTYVPFTPAGKAQWESRQRAQTH